jgi:spore germination protein GerM
VLEAQSQSKYIKRRIKRHQSSSPESVLKALKSLTKGTKAVMHKMALVRAKVQDLREANKILSQRRRAKRTKLQRKGVITVEEERQAINQMDINAQVIAESSRSSSQGR